jgi:hypothetical protein
MNQEKQNVDMLGTDPFTETRLPPFAPSNPQRPHRGTSAPLRPPSRGLSAELQLSRRRYPINHPFHAPTPNPFTPPLLPIQRTHLPAHSAAPGYQHCGTTCVPDGFSAHD